MDDSELKEWRQDWRRMQGAGSDACPPDEALADLAVPEGSRLSADERLALADHVTACRRCAALYRDLLDLHREAGGETALPRPRSRAWGAWGMAAAAALAVVLLAVWNLWLLDQNRRLAADLSAAAQEAIPRDDGAGDAAREALRQLDGLHRAAEAQTARIERLEDELATLRGPRFNVPVIDLDPAGGIARGGEASPRTVPLPAGVGLVTLILNPAEPPAAGSYRLEIAAADGRRVWSGEGLRPSSWDNFSLAVPRALLPDGLYRLRLQDGGGKTVETYEIRLATAR